MKPSIIHGVLFIFSTQYSLAESIFALSAVWEPHLCKQSHRNVRCCHLLYQAWWGCTVDCHVVCGVWKGNIVRGNTLLSIYFDRYCEKCATHISRKELWEAKTFIKRKVFYCVSMQANKYNKGQRLIEITIVLQICGESIKQNAFGMTNEQLFIQ